MEGLGIFLQGVVDSGVVPNGSDNGLALLKEQFGELAAKAAAYPRNEPGPLVLGHHDFFFFFYFLFIYLLF